MFRGLFKNNGQIDFKTPVEMERVHNAEGMITESIMKADTTPWQTSSAKSFKITSAYKKKEKSKFLLFWKRKSKKGTSLVNENKSSLRNFGTLNNFTKTKRKQIEQLIQRVKLAS